MTNTEISRLFTTTTRTKTSSFLSNNLHNLLYFLDLLKRAFLCAIAKSAIGQIDECSTAQCQSGDRQFGSGIFASGQQNLRRFHFENCSIVGK
jgi:hypothetical protein